MEDYSSSEIENCLFNLLTELSEYRYTSDFYFEYLY